MRAMILAAGLGTRLRPFTTATPKPLLPVANRPLLEYTFALLAGAGIGEVILNAHHLADELEDGLRRLDSSGVRVSLSRERKILGTAGGPKKAAPFLENGTFLLLNGDFLVDIDLQEVVNFHRRQGAAATMVLREETGGAIHVDSAGRIRQFLRPERQASPEWTAAGFTGIHVLEPEVLKLIHGNTPWEINRQVYPEMFRRGGRSIAGRSRSCRRTFGRADVRADVGRGEAATCSGGGDLAWIHLVLFEQPTHDR